MKFIIIAVMASLFSLAASADVACAIQAQNEAINIAVAKGLTYVAANVETEVESHSYSAKKVNMRVKASFTSTEEHEFLRIDFTMDLSSCKILKTVIAQDSRN